MNLYQEEIIDLYKNPLNKRVIKDAQIMHSGVNASCGDHIRIYLKIKDGKIIDASFEGEGCAISIAAASLLTEEIKGKKLSEVLKMENKEISALFGTELGPSRVKCGVLPLETLREAIRKNPEKNPKKNPGKKRT